MTIMTNEPETGTLAELNVKPGDVVRPEEPSGIWPDRHYEITEDRLIVDGTGDKWNILPQLKRFHIVSRASQSDTPKLWRDMTPKEKGAFWIRVYQGGIVEWRDHASDWGRDDDFQPDYFDDKFYRIRPEPVRETVTLTGGAQYEWAFEPYEGCDDTYRITFDLIDGKPDPTSIRMEEL